MFALVMPRFRGFFYARLALMTFMAFAALWFMAMRTAFAQAVTPTPPGLDVSVYLQLILGIAGIVVPVAIGLIATWLKTHFKLQADSAAAQTIDLAVTALTQLATAEITKVSASPTAMGLTLRIKNDAIASALTQLSAGTQAAMKLRGVTAETIAQRIDGALTLALTPPSPPAAATAPVVAKA